MFNRALPGSLLVRKGFAGLCLLFCTVLGQQAGLGAGSPVTLELVIPPAETHVIGDAIPLLWRFRNESTVPLAFMWEGCCRLNGRLDVSQDGRKVEAVPPTQALAHMFARAERLEPGVSRDFETRVSDWVHLETSGTYSLQGHYVGVRPEQQPRVARGFDLWRGEATSPSVPLTILSVEDYLAQRADRSLQRGLVAELKGPARIPLLDPATWTLRITNRTSSPQSLFWPADVQLWIVDDQGRRVAGSLAPIEDGYEEIQIAPGAAWERDLRLDPSRFEGEPLGAYQIFVDVLSSRPGLPRTPSNPLKVAWAIDIREAGEFLVQASEGAKTGQRNPALKLLRTYLGSLKETLQSVELGPDHPKAPALLEELRLAACLKPVSPVPGRVELRFVVDPNGALHPVNPTLAACLTAPGSLDAQAIASLMKVRRHLGWDVAVQLEPESSTPLNKVMRSADEWTSFASELAGAPFARAASPGTTNAGVIHLRTRPPPSDILVRIRSGKDGIEYAMAHSADGSSNRNQPGSPARTDPQEIRWKTGSAGEIREMLVAPAASHSSIQIRADGSLFWRDLIEFAIPLLEAAKQPDLSVSP